MDFTIKSRYGQVVLNKPVFFSLSYTNGPSSVSRCPHLNLNTCTCISEASWPILIKFMCSIPGMGERLHKVLGQIGSKLWFPWQQKPPLTYNGENNVSTFSRLFVIWYFLYLQVTRTCIKSRTSSNFCQIGPLTTELYALERSHWLWMGKMVSPSFLSYYEFRLHQTYRKWGQA